jgi:hypothetical protein
MSFQNQSGDLLPFTEVIPEGAQMTGMEKASILTQRRRMRTTPQSGPTLGTGGAGAGGNQLQFIVSDAGGLIDMRSVVLNYTIFTSGAGNPIPDDGHVFTTFQAFLNGQQLESIQNAPKVMNAEVTLGASKSWYQTAGSFAGMELLNNDLVNTVPTAAGVGNTAYGYVAGNYASIQARSSRPAAAVFNNIAGEQRSIPLGAITGLGRMRQYLPISILGELGLTLITGQAADVLFTTGATATADYSLSQISLEYDVVIPAQNYFSVLQKVAMENGAGLVLPYESTIVTVGGIVNQSASAQETSIIVSRATNNLLRATLVQVPNTLTSSIFYPSQSCFSHAGIISLQFRVGSLVFPSVAATGDASLFSMTTEAYGSVEQENGTVTNRCLWGNSTNGATAGTPAVYETSESASGGSVKFAYADRCLPTYGFQVVKGASQPLDVDGLSLSGASGSQIILALVSAPGVAYTPYVLLTALRYVVAKGGSVMVQGA